MRRISLASRSINRLKKLYFYNALLKRKTLQRDIKYLRLFFRLKKIYSNSDNFSYIDASRRLRICPGTVSGWIQGGKKPYLLHLVQSIPQKALKSNCKLLPLQNGKWKKMNYITVPSAIRSFIDIKNVLKQLPSFNLKKKKIVDSFFYILGVMVSDGCKGRNKTTDSLSFHLILSKKYKWSIAFGNGVCKNLRNLGIKAKRTKDIDTNDRNPNGSYAWHAESSTLIAWMNRSCLGLRDHENTKNYPIQASWLLHIPVSYKKSFLQGVADGDGSASVTDWRIQIRTKNNSSFFRRLFKGMNISSRCTDGKTVVSKYADVIRAIDLPIFRFAKGRAYCGNKIKSMILARSRRNAMGMEQINFVFRMFDSGHSIGTISSRFYDRFKIGLQPSHLRFMIKRGIENYLINEHKSYLYFEALRNYLQKKTPLSSVSYNTRYDWLYRQVVPIDVKRKLLTGYIPEKEILNRFGHLRKFMPNKIC